MRQPSSLMLGMLVACVSATAQVTAIKAGSLIDPDAGAALADQIILIRANKIEAVGRGLAIPSGATIIDLSNMTVLPGLIDCHTHLADGAHGDGDPISQLKKSSLRC